MSLSMRASLASDAITPSATFRCWRIFCAWSWSCQKSGCEVFASNEVMISRLRETSKIAPHELDSLLKFVLPPLQIFNDHVCPVDSRVRALRFRRALTFSHRAKGVKRYVEQRTQPKA